EIDAGARHMTVEAISNTVDAAHTAGFFEGCPGCRIVALCSAAGAWRVWDLGCSAVLGFLASPTDPSRLAAPFIELRRQGDHCCTSPPKLLNILISQADCFGVRRDQCCMSQQKPCSLGLKSSPW